MTSIRLVGLLVAIATFAGCGSVGAATGLPQTPSLPDRVLLVRAGIPVDAALTDISLAGDIEAGIQLAPAPTRHERMLTLALRRERGAVLDATVKVVGHMRFMDHGSFRVAGTAAGDGRYVVVLPLAMPGEWRLGIEVTSEAGSGEIDVELDTFD